MRGGSPPRGVAQTLGDLRDVCRGAAEADERLRGREGTSADDGTSSCGSSTRERRGCCRGGVVAHVPVVACGLRRMGGVKKKLEKGDWEKYIKENINIHGCTDLAARLKFCKTTCSLL